jgi:hypothetical protein
VLDDDGRPAYNPDASSYAANARKRVQLPDIKKRELRARRRGHRVSPSTMSTIT